MKDYERKGLVELFPMPEDERNKLIHFTAKGKEYADSIISKLRKVELFVSEEMGTGRMEQLNENMTMFVTLFSEAEGKNEEISESKMDGARAGGSRAAF